jgi:hypothetical protein
MFNPSAMVLNKSAELPLTTPETGPDSERAKQSPLPETPYKPYSEKPALPGPSYKPYAENPVSEPPYEPYKGM